MFIYTVKKLISCQNIAFFTILLKFVKNGKKGRIEQLIFSECKK